MADDFADFEGLEDDAAGEPCSAALLLLCSSSRASATPTAGRIKAFSERTSCYLHDASAACFIRLMHTLQQLWIHDVPGSA